MKVIAGDFHAEGTPRECVEFIKGLSAPRKYKKRRPKVTAESEHRYGPAMKTKEEYQEIARKGHATRRRNKK